MRMASVRVLHMLYCNTICTVILSMHLHAVLSSFGLAPIALVIDRNESCCEERRRCTELFTTSQVKYVETMNSACYTQERE